MDKNALNLEKFLPYHLVVAADLMSRALARVYAEYNITIPEWRVLVQLHQHTQLTPSALGRFSNMEKARVSRALILMQDKELIVRLNDANDKRMAQITLSAKGQALYNQIETVVVAWHERFEHSIGYDTHAQLLEHLKVVETWCRHKA